MTLPGRNRPAVTATRDRSVGESLDRLTARSPRHEGLHRVITRSGRNPAAVFRDSADYLQTPVCLYCLSTPRTHRVSAGFPGFLRIVRYIELSVGRRPEVGRFLARSTPAGSLTPGPPESDASSGTSQGVCRTPVICPLHPHERPVCRAESGTLLQAGCAAAARQDCCPPPPLYICSRPESVSSIWAG